MGFNIETIYDPDSGRKMTVADCIRAMSDEELTEWIHNIFDFDNTEDELTIHYKSIPRFDLDEPAEIKDTYEDILSWVKSVVKESETE